MYKFTDYDITPEYDGYRHWQYCGRNRKGVYRFHVFNIIPHSKTKESILRKGPGALEKCLFSRVWLNIGNKFRNNLPSIFIFKFQFPINFEVYMFIGASSIFN